MFIGLWELMKKWVLDRSRKICDFNNKWIHAKKDLEN